jgi:phage portal protein BeeE
VSFKDVKDQEKFDRYKREFLKMITGAKKMNSIVPISKEANVHEFGKSSQEMQYTESELMALRKFCAEYGVSSGLFNDPAQQ